MKNNFKGGMSANMTAFDVAKKWKISPIEFMPILEKGTEHEMEHTDNEDIARRIALDHIVERLDYYDKLEEIEKMKKGAVLETPTTLNDIVLYYEKKGNWLFAKGNFYAWLYDISGVGKKVESGEYDFIMFPPMGKGSPFSDRYVPPLLMVWQKTYQKNYKGSEHLLGIVKGFYDEDKNQLIIEMMTTNPKFRRQGINAHLIKQLRTEFGVSQEDVIFDKPTKEGSLFQSSKKYHLGGDMSKHLAPNGKPSNLTHEQWHLVRTPEFKGWFGFWDLYAYGKANEYYEPSVRNIAKELKENKLSAIEEVANFLSRQVTEDDVLIPMPSRTGISTDTKKLAEKISEKTGAKIFDCLVGRKRESIYQLKKRNENVSDFDFEFQINCEIPKAKNYFIVDNVIATGVTMKNALKNVMDKVGDNVSPLVYAIDLNYISKVVDENGEPLVVWHYSRTLKNQVDKFYIFNVDKELGSHFGTLKQSQSLKYNSKGERELEIVNEELIDFRYYQVFLNIKNPIRLKDEGVFKLDTLTNAIGWENLEDNDWLYINNYNNKSNDTNIDRAKYIAKSKFGYDGAVYLNRYESDAKISFIMSLDEVSDKIFKMKVQSADDSWIAFEPNQIKLADGTNTTFDGNNPDIRFANGGENLTNKELMANDFVNEQKELQRNSKYAILLDATWSNYTNEMREVYRDLQDEITKKLGYNPLVNYSPFSDNVILTFDDDSNLLGALEFTIEPQYTEVPRYSPSYIKPEPIFENNNNVFFIEYLFSFAKGNGQKIMNKLKQYAHKYNVDIGLYGSVVYREDQDKFMASDKHLQRFYDKQGFINVIGHYFLYSPNSMAKGGRTIAQTPAPASDRVSGSKTNPKGSASDTSLARSIKFNDSLLKAIENKVKAHNEEYPSKKVTTPTAKAVVRRGMGAYSKSHRPFITGGAPNSRQAWGLARLNKFLLKKRGVKVKSAYIQDDDLL